MSEWRNCLDKKPPIGEKILFYHNDIIHIGFLVKDDGSDKPRKWQWFSYIKNFEYIEDVYLWMPLPEAPNE